MSKRRRCASQTFAPIYIACPQIAFKSSESKLGAPANLGSISIVSREALLLEVIVELPQQARSAGKLGPGFDLAVELAQNLRAQEVHTTTLRAELGRAIEQRKRFGDAVLLPVDSRQAEIRGRERGKSRDGGAVSGFSCRRIIQLETDATEFVKRIRKVWFEASFSFERGTRLGCAVLAVKRFGEKKMSHGQRGLSGDGLFKLRHGSDEILLAQCSLAGVQVELRATLTDSGHLLKRAAFKCRLLGVGSGTPKDVEVREIAGLRGPERFKVLRRASVIRNKKAGKSEQEAGLRTLCGLCKVSAKFRHGSGVVSGVKLGEAEVERNPGHGGVKATGMLKRNDGIRPPPLAHERDSEVRKRSG